VKHLPKVFVIDHDANMLASLEALFTTEGYSVRCFMTAEGFYAQHHPTEVGCLVVDLMISGMGGHAKWLISLYTRRTCDHTAGNRRITPNR